MCLKGQSKKGKDKDEGMKEGEKKREVGGNEGQRFETKRRGMEASHKGEKQANKHDGHWKIHIIPPAEPAERRRRSTDNRHGH